MLIAQITDDIAKWTGFALVYQFFALYRMWSPFPSLVIGLPYI